ncbi:MAG: OmpH family outer membrane protein [Flavobacteriaceae bacterium]
MKSKLILIAICLCSLTASAQTKVGTINSELIIGLMPETKKVILLINAYGKRLDSSYQVKLKDYQAVVTAYNEKEKEYSEALKKVKYSEIVRLDQELQQSRQNGNKLIQIKRDEVMRPLYIKLKDAIAVVCKAEGYTQILTTSGNEFAYLDEKFDITQKVMDKLGVKLPKEESKK